MNTTDLLERKKRAMPHGFSIVTPVFAAQARNAEIIDIEGRRYIDFAAGIAVLNTGHRHPKVIAAAQAQLERFTHTCTQVIAFPQLVELAERINALLGAPGEWKTAFFTTGAEAVENAVKIARAKTGRASVVSFAGAFHGRTFMALALTGKMNPYKKGFGPLPGHVHHIPFPHPALGVTVQQTIAALEGLLASDVSGDDLAAVIFEPVQGEGGFYPMPAELAQYLRAFCDRHGALLIADEIQTGFGRTGKMFAHQHFGIVPDLVTMAKSLAGGFPLSGVAGLREVMDGVPVGGIGGTYAGNPISIAAAHAVLDVLEGERLCERASVLGRTVLNRMSRLAERIPQIADVRGLGAMVALEFRDQRSGKPLAEFALEVRQRALEAGLVLLTCGVHANVIRLLFPLTIEDAVFEEGIAILERQLSALAGEPVQRS
jgi:4-aminobutyrate aminotransferase